MAIVAPAFALAPSANFNGTPTSGCSPLTVLFVDMSTGTLRDYNWTFGDGGSSTAFNISHTYTAGIGTSAFTVSHGVNATLGAGSDIETKSAYITVTDVCRKPIDPNMIDTKNLSALIGNVGGLFPGVIALIISVMPLVIIMVIAGLVVAIFGGIEGMVQNLSKIIK